MIDSVGTNVTHDMERVFAGLPRVARSPIQTQPADPVRKPKLRFGVRTTALLALAAVLVGVIATLLFWPLAPRKPQVLQREVARPQAAPRPQVVLPQVAPIVRPEPPVTRQVRAVEPVKVPVAASAEKPREPKVKAASTPAARSQNDKPKVVGNRVKPVATPDAPSCQIAHDRAGCFYRTVLDADRALRRVYMRATNAKVPVTDLREVRSSWKTALSRSRKDPSGSVRTLESLAGSLQGKIEAEPRK